MWWLLKKKKPIKKQMFEVDDVVFYGGRRWLVAAWSMMSNMPNIQELDLFDGDWRVRVSTDCVKVKHIVNNGKIVTFSGFRDL